MNPMNSDKLSLYKVTDTRYIVKSNNKNLGEFLMDVDGFFYFWKEVSLQGCWDSFTLKCLADSLEELNRERKEEIGKDSAGGSSEEPS